MRRGLCFVFSVVIGFCAFAQKPANPINLKPQIKFESDTFDFGSLKESEPAVHFFTFKNTGNAPLIIVKVDKSCGCTTPQWPTEPIKPGATGKIRVEYDTKGRIGDFTKAVFVYTNVSGPPGILIIKGIVQMPTQPKQKMEIPQH
jgi:hypothetical protein